MDIKPIDQLSMADVDARIAAFHVFTNAMAQELGIPKPYVPHSVAAGVRLAKRDGGNMPVAALTIYEVAELVDIGTILESM